LVKERYGIDVPAWVFNLTPEQLAKPTVQRKVRPEIQELLPVLENSQALLSAEFGYLKQRQESGGGLDITEYPITEIRQPQHHSRRLYTVA
jgi:hypothetical protein